MTAEQHIFMGGAADTNTNADAGGAMVTGTSTNEGGGAPTNTSANVADAASLHTPSNPAPTLATERLSVGYDGAVLIKDVDITVQPGQIVTLIGPNGAGKSTILKTIAGYLQKIGGAVYLSGKNLEQVSPHEMSLELSVMLTERLRTELLTCVDIVETGRYPYTGRLGILSDEDRAKVRDAMEMVHVWDLRDRDFMQLSDGQRQRIMLARAIAQEPRTLMLDEPTNYLDIHYQIELLNVLRRLVATREVGVIMSLHELPLARKVSDYVLCVKGDSIVAQGKPDEIFVPRVIDGLYDLKPGTYDSVSGNIVLDEIE